MATINKIINLQQIGAQQVLKELKDVNAQLEQLRDTREHLKEQRNLFLDDPEKIKEIDEQLAKLEINYNNLIKTRTRLVNEQAVLLRSYEAEQRRRKENIDEIEAEVGSYNDLLAKRKELNNFINSTIPGTAKTISFDGQELARDQAIIQYRKINDELEKMKLNLLGVKEVEAGSLNDLIIKQRELNTFLSSTVTGTTQTITINGQELSREQAIVQYREINEQVTKLRSNLVDTDRVEIGSLNDLIIKQKELKTFIDNTNASTTKTVTFDGQQLSREQAIAQYKELNGLIERMGINLKETAEIEVGSLNDLIAKQRQLKSFIDSTNTASTKTLSFEGQNITREQAISQYKQLNEQIEKMKINYIDADRAEVNSLNDLIAKQKELQSFLSNTTQGTAKTISFDGQQLSREQALVQYQAINGQISKMQENFKGMGDVGTRINAGLAAGFDRMKSSLGAMILTYTGWFAAFREAGKLIEENIKLSDTFTDLQIRIHGTKDDVDKLFNSLKQIDTRTSLQNLVDIAATVAKKGVAKEEIAGLTKEFDRLNIVLGKELGDPATATANIIKLITVFNDDKHVTAERVQEIATSLFKLTTSGVATGEFLVNFAERVGAIRGITGLTLPSIFGMGAALQQLGQRVELSSTSIIQLTTRILSDVPKYANAAGKSIEDFRKLLDKDPFQALIAVAEGLKNLPANEIETKFEEIATAFQELGGTAGTTGVRIKAILGDIATNGKFVAERMKTAGVSAQDMGNLMAASELKQHTFAATLDRIRKSLELLGTDKSVQVLLAAIGSAILFLTTNLGVIITVLGIYAAAWTVANAELIAGRIATLALNAQLIIQRTVLATINLFQQAYTVSLASMVGVTETATAATTLFGLAMKALPFGAVITLLALFVAGCNRIVSAISGSTGALKGQAQQMQINAEVTAKANEKTIEQITKIDALAEVINDSTTSVNAQREALEKLIAINPRFKDAINEDVIALGAFNHILKDVKEQIELNARAEASAQLTGEKYAKYLEVINTKEYLRQKERDAQSKRKQAGATASEFDLLPIDLSDVTPTQKAVLKNIGVTDIFGQLGTVTEFSLPKIFKKLDDNAKEALANYQTYKKTSDVLAESVELTNKQNAEKAEENVGFTLEERIARDKANKVAIGELEAIIKAINIEIKKYEEGSAKALELEAARKEFQKRLDEAQGKKEPGGTEKPDQLTVGDKNYLKNLKANMDEELSIRTKGFNAFREIFGENLEEEANYVRDILTIHQNYLGQEIKHFEDKKNLNAAEKAELGKAKNDLENIEKTSVDKIKTIHNEEFRVRSQNIKEYYDEQIADIKVQNELIQKDQSLSYTERAEAQKKSDEQILELMIKQNEAIDKLEKETGVQSTRNAKERATQVAAQQRKIIDSAITIFNAKAKDIKDAETKFEDEYIITPALKKAEEIVKSGKAASTIARLLKDLEYQTNQLLLSSQIAGIKIELDLYRKGLSDKLLSYKEYLDAKKRLQELENKQSQEAVLKEIKGWKDLKQAMKDFTADFGEQVFGIKKYTQEEVDAGKKRADAEKETADKIHQAITEAYRGYFENQRNKIDAENDVLKNKIDSEAEQAKARAQSQAEVDSIDKKAAAQKRDLDRKAAQEKKQLALKELTIDYALGVMKSIAQFGLPLALLPIAAETVLYFVQRANIQAQSFAKGGYLAPTKTGGEVQGPSHRHGGVKFMYEAEGEELMIINKKSVQKKDIYTITGNVRQISSKLNEIGGGIAFTPGAKVQKRFEQGGVLGVNYQPPVFKASNTTDSTEFLEVIRKLDEKSDAINNRIDRLEVVQDTDTVTNAQKKKVKQKQIGVL